MTRAAFLGAATAGRPRQCWSAPRAVTRTFVLAAILATAGLLVACGSGPSTRYYTLLTGSQTDAGRATATATVAPVASPGRATSLIVGPVTVPESLDRPQLVLRISPTEQRILEQRRWIQAFDREVRAALVADLTRLLPGTEVAALGQNAIARPGWRVVVDVDRFEADPARGVWLQARWVLRDGRDQTRPAQSIDLRVERAPDGQDYDALVAAMRQAVDGLAGAIAAGLRQALVEVPPAPESAPGPTPAPSVAPPLSEPATPVPPGVPAVPTSDLPARPPA